MTNNETVTIWKFSAQNYQQKRWLKFQVIDKSVIFKLIWFFFHCYKDFFQNSVFISGRHKIANLMFLFPQFFFIALSLLYNVFE